MAISLPIVSKFDDKGVNQAESALDRLGGFAKGARLTTNASSQFVTQATAGGPVVAVALEAGTAGGYAEIELTPGATL